MATYHRCKSARKPSCLGRAHPLVMDAIRALAALTDKMPPLTKYELVYLRLALRSFDDAYTAATSRNSVRRFLEDGGA